MGKSNKKQTLRLKLLKELVEQIESGSFVHKSVDPDKLYQLHAPVRREYQSPNDISGYNWGHMSVWEMDAGMEDSF